MAESGLVLVIDDDEALRLALADALDAEGYRVWTARNGSHALEMLEQCAELPQLILLDLSMPGMGGVEFRQRQLQLPHLAPIPTYIFTAAGNLVETALEVPLTGLLRKPLSLDELLRVLQRHCGPRSEIG